MKEKLYKIMEMFNRVLILLLIIISIATIIKPLFLVREIKDITMLHYLEIHRTIGRLLSFIILIVAWKLYKRMSAAWTITVIALSVVLFQQLFFHRFTTNNGLLLIEGFTYFFLLLSKNYYCRKMNRYTLKRASILYLFYAVFVFFNAAIGLYNLRKLGQSIPFPAFLSQTMDLMLDSGNLNVTIFPQNMIYHRFLFWFSWLCIIIGLILVLTPYINERFHALHDLERARTLVKKFGQNCSSYLTLEKDKIHFFSKSVDGFLAYGIVKDTAVVLGDPICTEKDFTVLLAEFKNYCERNAYSLIFLNTTSKYLKEYEKLGFGCVKCGEEPRFYLKDYTLSGGNASKVRLNINHATKAGLTIEEYEPYRERDVSLEKELLSISEEWLTMKKSSELIFTMGGIGFENPMERRYFYARNLEGRVEGFMVFVPFAGMNGYMADVTRHRKGATRGVMEKIFYESMMKFKEEGIEWGSLAAAPLARLEEEKDVTAKFLNIIYEKMNGVYGFKTLYQTKLKYNPTYWEPSYYAYYPSVFTPALAYAIIKIQNPLGIVDYGKALIRDKKDWVHKN